MHPVDFVTKWTGVTRTERSAAQEHFLDLCRVLGVSTPADIDKDGSTYTFEKGATKSTGGSGWADVWYRGHFAWEYKGPNKDLGKAYDQLLRYKDHLENPPLLVVSDLDRIVIRTNFTNRKQVTHEITLATFAERESQDTLRRMWTAPMSFRPGDDREKVTEEAAETFGRLAQSLGSRGHDPHEVAHFLVQILFCLFAEDIGLLPNRVFSKLLDFGTQNPAHLRDETQRLMEAMGTGGFVAYETIPHVNGGLFREVNALELTPAEVDTLDAASHLDWSQVEPAIFGTLFERSLDPAQRSQLGAHYTGCDDILRVVEPVVMTSLRRSANRGEGDRNQASSDPCRNSLIVVFLTRFEETRCRGCNLHETIRNGRWECASQCHPSRRSHPMTDKSSTTPVSRRDVMRGAAGFGMLAPIALVAPAARAQDEEETPDYSGHPAVGVWIEGSGPTYAYQILHADGTVIYYNPWTSYFPVASDAKLPVWGFGVWKPTDERTVESTVRVAWGDTSVTTQMTFWARSTAGEDADQSNAEYRERVVDAAGKVLVEDQGVTSVRRMRWEPFEEPVASETT